MTQTLSVAAAAGGTAPREKPPGDYIYEQPPLEMLERLMPRYVEVAIFRAMLETVAPNTPPA
jgi:F-type H+-transporting ATPase subunit gamma